MSYSSDFVIEEVSDPFDTGLVDKYEDSSDAGGNDAPIGFYLAVGAVQSAYWFLLGRWVILNP